MPSVSYAGISLDQEEVDLPTCIPMSCVAAVLLQGFMHARSAAWYHPVGLADLQVGAHTLPPFMGDHEAIIACHLATH